MAEFVLGQQSAYPTHYDPHLLFPIARAKNRASLGVHNKSSPLSLELIFGMRMNSLG